ncbi:MAG: NUDIX domain-containing protein [Candidatus Paceibacterota bacterium]|jgi:ADP-ribose pyrophosphatase YjhB (NUDIX family)
MENKTKIFVGMLVMTKLKLSENLEEETVALLQRRGKINTDNDYGFKWQSFNGLCEITSYGKAEQNETPEEALKRETIEELGEKASKTIFESKPIKIYEKIERDDDNVFVWATLCNKNILKEIKLDISTGGIEIIRKDDLEKINFANFEQKGLEVKNLDEIKLFEVPIAVLERAFEIFK